MTRRPVTLAAATFLGLMVMVAVFADLLAGDSPIVAMADGGLRVFPGVFADGAERSAASDADWAIWPAIRFGDRTPCAAGPSPPSKRHWLGTDADGIDIAARLVHGARGTVLTTLLVLCLATILGVTLGAAAGYGIGPWEGLLARAVEVTGALPSVVLIALVAAITEGPSVAAFVVVVSALRAVEIARLVRGEVLRIAGQDFVLAARALGATRPRILRAHVLRHCLGPVLVSVSFAGATVVSLEAALGYLGLGVPGATWGALLSETGRGAGLPLLLPPAVGTLLTVASLYLVAEAVDDSLSPRRRIRSARLCRWPLANRTAPTTGDVSHAGR